MIAREVTHTKIIPLLFGKKFQIKKNIVLSNYFLLQNNGDLVIRNAEIARKKL